VLRLLALCGLILAGTLVTQKARADVSSWANASAGPSFIDEGEDHEMESQGALSLQAGLGTTPANFVSVGGLFHLETHFTRGTDLGLLARVATQGYNLGRWGVALDFGGYERFWGVRHPGLLGGLVLGVPWGLTLRGEAGWGPKPDARMYGIVLGVDFARLTVFRTVGEDWYPNPFPGYREKK
jgi:hypothetical protein